MIANSWVHLPRSPTHSHEVQRLQRHISWYASPRIRCEMPNLPSPTGGVIQTKNNSARIWSILVIIAVTLNKATAYVLRMTQWKNNGWLYSTPGSMSYRRLQWNRWYCQYVDNGLAYITRMLTTPPHSTALQPPHHLLVHSNTNYEPCQLSFAVSSTTLSVLQRRLVTDRRRTDTTNIYHHHVPSTLSAASLTRIPLSAPNALLHNSIQMAIHYYLATWQLLS